MVLAKDLRQAVLQAALQGKLTEQLETDSNVGEILKSIQEEKNKLVADKKSKKKTALPEIQDEDISFDIPDNWRWIKIGEIVDIKNGFTPKRTDETLWNPREIPWFTVEDIHEQGLNIFHTAQSISKKALGKTNGRIIPAHTVLLCCTSATIGRYAMTEIELTTNQQWNGLVIKKERKHIVCSDYILVWVSSLKEKMTEIAKSTTFPFLSVDKLANFVIPLPPIEEQQRIVDKINEIMPKIDEYEKIEKELEALKKEFPNNMKDALLQAAMQGKLTKQLESDSNVDELLWAIEKEKKELVAQKKIKKEKPLLSIEEEEIPFDIPENWRWVRLKNICTKIVDGDHNPPRGTLEKTEYLMLSAQNINFDKLVDLDQVRYLTKEIFEQENLRTQVQTGDIFFTIVGTLGRSCIYTGGYNISFQRSVAVISTKIYNRYLKCVLDSPYIQQYMVTKATGTAQKGFYLNQVDNLLIPIPSFEEQRRIVERLDTLLPMCEDLKEG